MEHEGLIDILLETVRRRDYHLRIIWECRECGSKFVKVFLHRDKLEVETGARNIKQMCEFRHITIPFKRCDKCGKTYLINQYECDVCEPRVKRITELELAIEETEKELENLEKEYKKGRVQEDDYTYHKKWRENTITQHKLELEQLAK